MVFQYNSLVFDFVFDVCSLNQKTKTKKKIKNQTTKKIMEENVPVLQLI